GRGATRRLLEALELRRDGLDATGHVPALGLPLALLPLERGELVQERAGILALQLGLGLLEPALELRALLLELGVPAAELGKQRPHALAPLREATQIGDAHRRVVHVRSLNWPPHPSATAATMRDWSSPTSASASVRSRCWNWSAYARLFIPGGV